MFPQPSFDKIQPVVLQTGSIFTVILFLVIPLSTALATISSIVIYVLWILSAQFLNFEHLFKNNNTTLYAILFLVLLTIGMTYSPVSFAESFVYLKKYRKFFLFIALLPFLEHEKYRKLAFHAFALASIITLAASYAMFMDLIPIPESAYHSPGIRMRITHSLFIAFFAFYCAHQILNNSVYRVAWIILFLLSTYNIFFMVQGRTGQLIYFLLLTLFSFQRLSKLKTFCFIGANVLFLILFLNFSAGGSRLHEGVSNSRSYLQGQTETRSSMGQRLTFWKHTVEIILQKPMFGFGTGSFASEYAKLSQGDEVKTDNPHSEYLMITAQLGIIGLCLFLTFLYSYYQNMKQLPSHYRWFAQGTLLTLLVNGSLNSTFLDHTEGHWFACLMALSLAPLTHAYHTAAKSKA